MKFWVEFLRKLRDVSPVFSQIATPNARPRADIDARSVVFLAQKNFQIIGENQYSNFAMNRRYVVLLAQVSQLPVLTVSFQSRDEGLNVLRRAFKRIAAKARAQVLVGRVGRSLGEVSREISCFHVEETPDQTRRNDEKRAQKEAFAALLKSAQFHGDTPIAKDV